MTRLNAVRTAVTAVTLIVVGAGTLRAQRLDTTLAARGQTRFSVSNQSGSITIRSWPRQQVRVQAEYDRAVVEITESAGRIGVRTQSRHGSNEVDFTISVPRGTAIEINGISSDVTVTDVCGDLNLNTIS